MAGNGGYVRASVPFERPRLVGRVEALYLDRVSHMSHGSSSWSSHPTTRRLTPRARASTLADGRPRSNLFGAAAVYDRTPPRSHHARAPPVHRSPRQRKSAALRGQGPRREHFLLHLEPRPRRGPRAPPPPLRGDVHPPAGQ